MKSFSRTLKVVDPLKGPVKIKVSIDGEHCVVNFLNIRDKIRRNLLEALRSSDSSAPSSKGIRVLKKDYEQVLKKLTSVIELILLAEMDDSKITEENETENKEVYTYEYEKEDEEK